MSNGPIQSVKSASGQLDSNNLPAAAMQHGALTKFEDGEAVFTGNGVTTPTDVAARLLELEAESDPSISPFAKAREAAMLVAGDALENNNPHLKDQNLEEPVPAGEQMFTRFGDDMKALLAPFKGRLGELRQFVSDMQTGMGGASKTTGHGVQSKGLAIPTGGSGSGEPEGVMAGDPAEIMARMGIKPG